MRFLLTTDPGLEDLAADETAERLPDSKTRLRPYDRSGQLLVEAGSVAELLALTTIHHVIEIRGEAEVREPEDIPGVIAGLDFPEVGGAVSFRVTSRCEGDVAFGKLEMQRAAGGVIHERYGTKVDLEGYEVEVRVDLYGDRLVAGIQRTRDSLHNRLRRARPLRSALKPNVAAAMIRLAGAHRGEGRLIDPMCGAGTIPMEAAQANPNLEVLASDWDEETVEVARETLANHGLAIDVSVADARGLGDSSPDRFDYIVTDPPYGLRQARRTGIARLYRSLLPSFESAVKPSGAVVLIVVKYRAFLAALEQSGLRVAHERVVDLGGIRPRIYVLRRS